MKKITTKSIKMKQKKAKTTTTTNSNNEMILRMTWDKTQEK